MKKLVVAAILGLAAVTSVKAQTYVFLYNYGTPSAGSIVYGINSGGPVGTGVTGGYTVSLYWAVGDITASVNGIIGGATTQAGANQGTLVGAGLSIPTGPGATVALGPDGPGLYDSTVAVVLNPIPLTPPELVTIVLVAYQTGLTYETSSIRGHSSAFTMTAYNPLTPPIPATYTGTFAPAAGFAVAAPEPSTFALAGLGLASLLLFRRRK